MKPVGVRNMLLHIGLGGSEFEASLLEMLNDLVLFFDLDEVNEPIVPS